MKALSCGALAVMSVVLLGDVSALVAAAATRAAVDWRAAAAAVNWLGDGGWGWGGLGGWDNITIH